MKSYRDHAGALEAILSRGYGTLIDNIDGNVASFGEFPLIVTATDNPRQSYISSLPAAYVDYPRDELSLVQGEAARLAARLLLDAASLCFRLAGLNRCVFVGNFPFSTNLYPDDFDLALSRELPMLCTLHPDAHLVVRSLNTAKNAPLIARMRHGGWTMWPARIVYMFDADRTAERRKKNHCKNDAKLLMQTPYRLDGGPFDESDYRRMAALYAMLYLEKHSSLNAAYTAEFIRKCHEGGLLHIDAYRSGDRTIVAFIAAFECEGIVSTPMLGYDTALPQEQGLYRLLFMTLLRRGEDRGYDVNYSSGAAGFKKARGGIGTLEYTAIYTAHLPRHRRFVVRMFGALLNGMFRRMARRLEL